MEYHETFSTIAENQVNQMNQVDVRSVVSVQSKIESIFINDYGKMNFFPQGASNVTIYLSSDDGDNFINENCYDEVIDLITSSSSDDSSEQDSEEDEDIPEVMDLSQLKFLYQKRLYEKTEKEKQEVVRSLDVAEVEEDDDDDVVFVKEYKMGDNDSKEEEEYSLPLDLRYKTGEIEKSAPKRRRNPKRTVRLLTEYYNRSNFDLYGKEKRKRNCCDTKKKTGAVLNSIPLLTNKHGKDKKNGPVKKVKEGIKKKTYKKGERRGRKVKNKEEVDKQFSKEFAVLTQETLQDVVSYVHQLKEYNSIVKDKNDTTEAEVAASQKNLKHVKDILTDSYILYSIANDVPQKSISKYLKTIRKDFK